MQAVTNARTPTAPAPAVRPRAGRIIGTLATLFLAFDGAIKVLQLAPAVEGSAQLGYSASQTLGIGLLALACLPVYVIPRTSVLGAVLLTGYLGGAIASHLRAGSPPFPVLFPLLIGALLWGALVLRDARLRALLAPRQ